MRELVARRCSAFLLLALVCTATGSGLADDGVVPLDCVEKKVQEPVVGGASNQAPETHPSKGIVAGEAEQIHALILKTERKSDLEMTATERAEFENSESVDDSQKIAKSELPQNVEEVVKMVEKQNADAKEGKVASDDEPSGESGKADHVYHRLLIAEEKQVELVGMPPIEKEAWLASSAAKLAKDEQGAEFVSNLKAGAMKKLTARAKELQAELQVQKEDLARLEQESVSEKQAKQRLISDSKTAAQMESRVEAQRKESVQLKLSAQEGAKTLAAQWVQLTESGAHARKMALEVTKCLVNKKDAEQKVTASTAAMAEAAEAQRDAEAKMAADGAPVAALNETLTSIKVELNEAQANLAIATTGMKSAREECARKQSLLQGLKAEGLKMTAAHKAAKIRQHALVKKAQRLAEEAKSSKNGQEGLDTTAAAATRMLQVVHVVSATHYCAMKQEKTTKQWSPVKADFIGDENEKGNQNANLTKVCSGKPECSISVLADQAADCPRTGYIARYRCQAADAEAPTSEQAADAEAPTSELGESADPVSMMVSKLSSKLSSEGDKPPERISLDEVSAKLKELASKPSDGSIIEVKMQPGSEDRTIKLACKSNAPPEEVGEALANLQKAREEFQQNDVDLVKVEEKAADDREQAAAKAKAAAAKAKADLQKAEKREQEAANMAAQAAAEQLALREQLVQETDPQQEELKKEELETANAKQKQAAKAEQAEVTATEELKAETETLEKKEVKAEQASGKEEKAEDSPDFKPLAKELLKADTKVQETQKALEAVKDSITTSSDATKIIALSSKVQSATKAAASAKAAQEEARQDLNDAKGMDLSKQSAKNQEEIENDQGNVRDAKAKMAALVAQKASVQGVEAQEMDTQVEQEKKKLESAETNLEQATSQAEGQSESALAEGKQDSGLQVEEAQTELKDKENKLTQTKDAMAKAVGAQVLVEAGKLQEQANAVNEVREKLAAAEKDETDLIAASKTKLDGSGNQEADDEVQEKKDDNAIQKLEAKSNQLKQELDNTRHPSKVAKLAQEMDDVEADRKKSIAKLAADKAKVAIDEQNGAIAAVKKAKAMPRGKPIVKKTLIMKDTNDPAVKKAEAILSQSAVAQKAAGAFAAQTVSQKLDETTERMDALLKTKRASIIETQSSLRHVAATIKMMNENSGSGAKSAQALAKLKKNIIQGVPFLHLYHGFPGTTIKENKVRSAAEIKTAVSLLNATSQESAVCGKQKSCCLTAFQDNDCKEQKDVMCSAASNLDATTWKPMVQISTTIGDAKTATLDIRWSKDKSAGLQNEGEVLRLRVCGRLKKEEGHSCYPKEGAGLRFGQFFNAPFGQCLQAEDLIKVSPYKLNGAVIKMVDATSSAKASTEDVALQKSQLDATKRSATKTALSAAFLPPKDSLMDDLVLQLLDMEAGEFLKPCDSLLAITGSFSLNLVPVAAST